LQAGAFIASPLHAEVSFCPIINSFGRGREGNPSMRQAEGCPIKPIGVGCTGKASY
jgi:hypothetical protein